MWILLLNMTLFGMLDYTLRNVNEVKITFEGPLTSKL